jgi:hypothetical protein
MNREFMLAVPATALLTVLVARADQAEMYKPWTMHHVCRDFLIANSLNAADVDGDGFKDYSVIDERRDLMTIVFHPGKGGEVRKEWPRMVLGQTGNPEYACLGDLDGDGNMDMVVVKGDGLPDLVTQTQNSLHLFRRETKAPAAWKHIVVPKPEFIQWIGRPVKFADLNGDGRADIIGALIHNDGNLPKDKASVFWLENNGGPPASWKAYPIKWSDGANTRDQWIGEKWDHLIPLDVDGDGDLDLLGNVEEHFHRGPDGKDVSWFSVVWFENPLK